MTVKPIERQDYKARRKFGSLNALKTMADIPKSYPIYSPVQAPHNLSHFHSPPPSFKPSPYNNTIYTPPQHPISLASKAPQIRHTFQQPINLRSLVSNMELLRVPSRALRYDNEHMLKSLGYCFSTSDQRTMSKPIVHSSTHSLQIDQTSASIKSVPNWNFK